MKKLALVFLTSVLLGGLAGYYPKYKEIPQAKQADANGNSSVQTEFQVKAWTWSDIESTNEMTLASNLRTVACPEDVIRDLLTSRINRRYANLLLTDPMQRHWETPEEAKARNQLMAQLRQEQSQLMDQLGYAEKRKQPVKLPDPFSSEKMEQIAKITEQYPNRPLPAEPTQEEYAQSYTNRHARLDYLSQSLTPDELIQYRLTQDSNVGTVSRLLGLIGGTEDEINKAAFVFDFTPAAMNNGHFDPAVEQALKDALGEQRLEELVDAFSPDNRNFSLFVLSSDLSADQVSTLRQLRQQNLPADQMQTAVTSLLGKSLAQQYFKVMKPAHP